MAPSKFTICIPSYNRGQAALRQVLHTLPLLPPDWEILVLDNCSNQNLQGYLDIESISEKDHRLRYVKHDRNLGFHGNVLASLKFANSAYLQIISDEDYSNTEVVRDAIHTLDRFPHIGLIRGSLAPIDGMAPRNSFIYPDQLLNSGRDALSIFSLTTNYLSGVIYNRLMLDSLGIIDKFAEGLNRNPMIAVYAHMYLDILISASCSVATSREIVCFEGEEQSYTSDVKSTAESFPYTFSGRLEQIVGFRDAFRDVCSPNGLNDRTLLIYLYSRLVQKYCLLFQLDSFLYKARGLELHSLKEALKHFFMSAACIDEFEPFRGVVQEKVLEQFRSSFSS